MDMNYQVNMAYKQASLEKEAFIKSLNRGLSKGFSAIKGAFGNTRSPVSPMTKGMFSKADMAAVVNMAGKGALGNQMRAATKGIAGSAMRAMSAGLVNPKMFR
jgi:hypothetical protein